MNSKVIYLPDFKNPKFAKVGLAIQKNLFVLIAITTHDKADTISQVVDTCKNGSSIVMSINLRQKILISASPYAQIAMLSEEITRF